MGLCDFDEAAAIATDQDGNRLCVLHALDAMEQRTDVMWDYEATADAL